MARGVASAQRGVEAIAPESFVQDAALRDATVHAIDFKPGGDVWLATSAGLVAFDSVVWSHFATESGLPSALVTAVEWSGDELWVGTDRGAGQFVDGRFRSEGPAPTQHVRRIAEQGTGELWICASNGTFRRRGSQWQRVLESEQAFDILPLHDDEMLVVTLRKLFRVGPSETVELSTPPGFDPALRTSAVADPTQPGLVLSTRDGLRVANQTRDGTAWRPFGPDPRKQMALLRTRDGCLIALSSPSRTFVSVSRVAVRPISGAAPPTRGMVHGLAEAPDGAVWAFGDGLLLRWRRTCAPARHDMPPPLFCDPWGRIWFADAQSVVWHRSEEWKTETALAPPIACSAGGVLARLRGAATIVIVRRDEREHTDLPFPVDGRLHLVVDGAGVSWALAGPSVQREAAVAEASSDGQRRAALVGVDAHPGESSFGARHGSPRGAGERRIGDDEAAAAAAESTGLRAAWLATDGRWHPVEFGALADQIRSVHATADPSGGLWLSVLDEDQPRILRVLADATPLALEPPDALARGDIAIDASGRAWVVGVSGLWTYRVDERWREHGERWTRSVDWITQVGGRVVSGSRHCRDGVSGIRIVDDGGEQTIATPTPRVIGRDHHGVYVAGGAAVYLIAAMGPVTTLPAIDASDVAAIAIDAEYQAWIGRQDRTLRMQPLPRPRVFPHPRAEYLLDGASADVDIAVAYSFVPRHQLVEPCASIKWRVDGGPWTKSVALSSPVRLAGLAVGAHSVEFVAYDALGRVSPASTVVVRVAARPLQERTWFPLAVAGICTLVFALAVLALATSRRLAVQATRLRRTVERRTHKIRSELFRRRRAERHLRHQHRVLGMLATGKPIEQALDALALGLEAHLPRWRVAICLVDEERLRLVAAPSLWNSARELLYGRPLVANGCPGSRAVLGRHNVSLDIDTDPGDSSWRQAARAAGVKSVHAQPIHSTTGVALGVLVLLRDAPGTVSRDQAGIVAAAAHIAAVAIESERGEAERHELQQQMLNAQKLRSLGLLAGGIAHDFNNLLTGILGNAGLARMQTVSGSPVDETLSQVETATQRAAELCTQLLAYSGRGRFVVKPVDLSALVQEMVQMLRLPMSRKIALDLALSPDLPATEVDATQVRQVLMNLMTNAAEAVGDSAGRVAITTGVIELTSTRLRGLVVGQGVAPGRYVFVEVCDSGCGMTEQTRRSVFDPFFTTKTNGRGLGMAAVQGIVRGHRGAIELLSELGRGTTIRVFLTASDKAVEASSCQVTLAPRLHESGVVLLAEDEPIVRELAHSILTGAGFDVVAVRDGASAARLVAENTGEFRVAVLDIVMPGLTGHEVLAAIRASTPNLPVILSSGNEMVDASVSAGDPYTFFLKKPYGPQALLDAMRAALGANRRELPRP